MTKHITKSHHITQPILEVMEATTIPGNDLMASDFGDELGDGMTAQTQRFVMIQIGVPEGVLMMPKAIASFSLVTEHHLSFYSTSCTTKQVSGMYPATCIISLNLSSSPYLF
jgi:hypothetical protein